MLKTFFLKGCIFCFLIILFFFSCSSDDPSSSSCAFIKEGKIITSVIIEDEDTQSKISIVASDNWSLTSDCDWCSVSLSSGDGMVSGLSKLVVIDVAENNTGKERTAHLLLVSGKSSSKLEVIQKVLPLDPSGWESASTAVKNMKTGWNLGNTLDAINDQATAEMNPSVFETYWGQPITTKAMIDKFKEAGFNAIRIPVTWGIHMDANGIVVESWMNRVEEVVNYVLDDGMYCVLNVHHDTGAGTRWLSADINLYPTTSVKFKSLWTQIANRFKDYGDHLIFESYNEMLDGKSNWGEPKDDSSYKALNQLAQDFVDAVRATGGNNSYRNLCVNTYGASYTSRTLANFEMPTDNAIKHLMAQVHMYVTYSFAQDAKSSDKVFTTEIQQSIIDGMKAINDRFCLKHIPVIIGEYGAVAKDNQEERAKHAACIVSEAKKYNITCFRWMGLLDRKNLTWDEPLIKDAIIKSVQ